MKKAYLSFLKKFNQLKEKKMDFLNGMTKQEAIAAGILVPIDITDREWLKKWLAKTAKPKSEIEKK
jgi:hypothetical protein